MGDILFLKVGAGTRGSVSFKVIGAETNKWVQVIREEPDVSLTHKLSVPDPRPRKVKSNGDLPTQF